LNSDWETLYEGLDTENMWQLLHSKLLFLIDKCMPTKSFEPHSRPKWLNSSVLKAIKQKHKVWNTYKTTHCHSDYVSCTTKRETLQLPLSKGPNITFISICVLEVCIREITSRLRKVNGLLMVWYMAIIS